MGARRQPVVGAPAARRGGIGFEAARRRRRCSERRRRRRPACAVDSAGSATLRLPTISCSHPSGKHLKVIKLGEMQHVKFALDVGGLAARGLGLLEAAPAERRRSRRGGRRAGEVGQGRRRAEDVGREILQNHLGACGSSSYASFSRASPRRPPSRCPDGAASRRVVLFLSSPRAASADAERATRGAAGAALPVGAPLLLLLVELRSLPVKLARSCSYFREYSTTAVARRVPALGLHALAHSLASRCEELVGLGHKHPQRAVLTWKPSPSRRRGRRRPTPSRSRGRWPFAP